MKTAFKEWAVICRALGTGRQVLILRKGGIGEEAGTFRPEHREFLFFPTGFHQSPGKVLPEADRLLREAEAEQPSADQVTFRHFAIVTDAIRVASLSALRALRGQHLVGRGCRRTVPSPAGRSCPRIDRSCLCLAEARDDRHAGSLRRLQVVGEPGRRRAYLRGGAGPG